jgi:serine/threonine protein kinase
MTNRVGQQFGNYRLIRLLGQGGFAEVYLGQHVLISSKQEAIKVLTGPMTSQQCADFKTEAETLAKLKNRYILQLVDFGMDGNTPFLVIEYAPDGTLRDRHPQGSILTLSTVISYVQQIALALDYAHGQRIVHRDIKPSNMLVHHDGHVVLSDFGIAVALDQITGSLNTPAAVGTTSYMAPESISGQASQTSDQYSLAVVTYEWLCGVLPFYGSTPWEIVLAHLHNPPPPLRTKNPQIPYGIEQVVLKALDKDPQQRYPSVKAFASALAQKASTASWVQQPSTRPLPQQTNTAAFWVQQPGASPLPPQATNAALAQQVSYHPNSTTYPVTPLLPQTPNPHLPRISQPLPPSQETAIHNILSAFQYPNFYLLPDEIPYEKRPKIVKAKEVCDVPNDDKILGLIDRTFLGFPKNCMLFGTKNVYTYTRSTGSQKIPYADFPRLIFAPQGNSRIITNTAQFIECPNGDNPLEQIIDVLDKIREVITPTPPLALQQLRIQQILRKLEQHKHFYLLPDPIPYNRRLKLINAMSVCQALRDEKILGLIDRTILSHFVKGYMLFGTKHLYVHEKSNKNQKIPYSDFQNMIFSPKWPLRISTYSREFIDCSWCRIPRKHIVEVLDEIKRIS